jgi:2-polyprenyl-6-methoxyphenol hydroxylase-like FAD-dependent oxidoreductase
MGLHWGAKALRNLLGEAGWSRIQTVQVDPNVPTKPNDVLNFYNAESGEKASGAEISYFYRLKRSALRKLLSEELDIRFGKKLVGIEYHDDGHLSTAKFDDGTSVTAALIVGADGAKSTVRELLLSPEKAATTKLPYAATFIQARFSKEQAEFLRSFHPLYLAGIHPDNKFAFFGMQDAPVLEDPTTWTFFFYISWCESFEEQEQTAQWTSSQRLAQAKGFAKRFADPWRSAYEWLPDDAPVWYMTFVDWDPGAEGHCWDNHGGRVTLAGDAAHVMTYQRGQGLNHSITDAANLLDAITKSKESDSETSRADAISQYEEEVRQRAGNEVRTCTMNTGMIHNWQKAMNSPVMRMGMKKN